MKNDPHNEHKAEAQKIARKYRRILRETSHKARMGDKQASLNIIQQLTEFHSQLKIIGYRTTSEDEPGKSGRVVAITPEWKSAQLAKESLSSKLARKLRNEKLAPKEYQATLREFLKACSEDS